jgi:serine/threonine protein kinase
LKVQYFYSESFTLKVADFGLVPVPTRVGHTSLMTVAGAIGLAGTRGYVAPEYNDGKRGPRTDVYSYGIV